jgi:hypothetical protein
VRHPKIRLEGPFAATPFSDRLIWLARSRFITIYAVFIRDELVSLATESQGSGAEPLRNEMSFENARGREGGLHEVS